MFATLTLRQIEEKKAAPGKFRAMIMIDSENYQIEQDQGTFDEARMLCVRYGGMNPVAVYNDQGNAVPINSR